MFSIFNKFFDSNDREIQHLRPIVEEINSLSEKVKKYKDKDFPKKTQEFKERIAKGESLDSLLPEAFALVREATRRTIGLSHYDVQMMAAIVLSRGKVAEQRTGEGKTLSAIPALYLHALTGKGVHLVTVNDYLARRDAGWMGPVFSFLGITVASIISEQSFQFDPEYLNETAQDPRLQHLKTITRKEAYQCDVVYGINSEFGFDYLRDNMAQDINQVVQPPPYYAVVDEVDSVLIDEARTPHIISQPDEVPSQKYYEYAQIVDKLQSDTDYKVDEKDRTVHLTDHGLGKIEKLYGIANIYEKDFDTVYHLEAALKARTLFHKEKDYIVRDNEVILVDEFTGRLMVGRRLSDGIHQAIEAKENVPIQRESKTLATVSLQNYFRLYERLAGMTGTALTEAEEFSKIYKLDVVVIPTHNPMQREDKADVIYKSSRAKFTAVVAEIERVYKTGQPVLVGTTSIDKNEIIGQLLQRRKIPHQILNAKNHLKEAEIIAQAGRKGAVTVATNMAGRGVDIILGGAMPEATLDKKMLDDRNLKIDKEVGKSKLESLTSNVQSQHLASSVKHQTSEQNAIPNGKKNSELEKWKKEHNEVLNLGGLYVLGTERHESRRIDNQLRGRSGRQGDPGVSQFFVSLDDDIMRLFGGDRIAGIMTRFNMPEDVPLTHPLVSKAIENAQVKVERHYFDTRKHLVEYDDVLNKQREIIYARRRKALEAAKEIATQQTLRQDILDKTAKTAQAIVMSAEVGPSLETTPSEKMISNFMTIVPFDEASQKQLIKQLEQLPSNEEKIEFLTNITKDIYMKRVEQFGEPIAQQIERMVMLGTIDTLWMNHLDVMDNLRQGIGLRAHGQRDPLVEYKNEGYRLFEKLIFSIDDEIVHRIFHIQVQPSPDNTHQHIHMGANGQQHVEPSAPPVIASPKGAAISPNKKAKNHVVAKSGNDEAISSSDDKHKLGRNDPCWCGSGKKFKKCHWPNLG